MAALFLGEVPLRMCLLNSYLANSRVPRLSTTVRTAHKPLSPGWDGLLL